MRNRVLKSLSIKLFMISSLFLAACSSIISPVDTSVIIDLLPIEASKLKGAKSYKSLTIIEPRTANILDSDKILVKPNPVLIQYFPNVVLSDSMPKLLERRLIETFEDSKRFRSVAGRNDGFDSKYDLLLEVRSFQLEPATGENAKAGQLQAKIEVFAKLILQDEVRILRSKKVMETELVLDQSPEQIAIAFNKAFERSAIKLLDFAVR